MKSTRHILSTILATILLSASAITSSHASAIKLVVVDSDSKETEYSIPDFKGCCVELPIYLDNQRYIFEASFPEDDNKNDQGIDVTLKDPSVIIPGLAVSSGGVYPHALSIYSATLPNQAGKRILVLKTPKYSLWLQYEPTKANKS